jgi:hypothetical protein
MTEDDTFRRLKRIPYEEMRAQIIQISLNLRNGTKSAALKAGGWTYEEYRDERVKDAQRRNNMPRIG